MTPRIPSAALSRSISAIGTPRAPVSTSSISTLTLFANAVPFAAPRNVPARERPSTMSPPSSRRGAWKTSCEGVRDSAAEAGAEAGRDVGRGGGERRAQRSQSGTSVPRAVSVRERDCVRECTWRATEKKGIERPSVRAYTHWTRWSGPLSVRL